MHISPRAAAVCGPTLVHPKIGALRHGVRDGRWWGLVLKLEVLDVDLFSFDKRANLFEHFLLVEKNQVLEEKVES